VLITTTRARKKHVRTGASAQLPGARRVAAAIASRCRCGRALCQAGAVASCFAVATAKGRLVLDQIADGPRGGLDPLPRFFFCVLDVQRHTFTFASPNHWLGCYTGRRASQFFSDVVAPPVIYTKSFSCQNLPYPLCSSHLIFNSCQNLAKTAENLSEI